MKVYLCRLKNTQVHKGVWSCTHFNLNVIKPAAKYRLFYPHLLSLQLLTEIWVLFDPQRAEKVFYRTFILLSEPKGNETVQRFETSQKTKIQSDACSFYSSLEGKLAKAQWRELRLQLSATNSQAYVQSTWVLLDTYAASSALLPAEWTSVSRESRPNDSLRDVTAQKTGFIFSLV